MTSPICTQEPEKETARLFLRFSEIVDRCEKAGHPLTAEQIRVLVDVLQIVSPLEYEWGPPRTNLGKAHAYDCPHCAALGIGATEEEAKVNTRHGFACPNK